VGNQVETKIVLRSIVVLKSIARYFSKKLFLTQKKTSLCERNKIILYTTCKKNEQKTNKSVQKVFFETTTLVEKKLFHKKWTLISNNELLVRKQS
jgi:hypothetical protein